MPRSGKSPPRRRKGTGHIWVTVATAALTAAATIGAAAVRRGVATTQPWHLNHQGALSSRVREGSLKCIPAVDPPRGAAGQRIAAARLPHELCFLPASTFSVLTGISNRK